MTNVDRIKDRTRGVIIDQVDRGTTIVGSRVRDHAASVRSMSESLREQGYTATADVVETAAGKMNSFSKYLVDNDGERVVHDLEAIARKRPVFTAALGLLIGLLGARLLKAGARGSAPSTV